MEEAVLAHREDFKCDWCRFLAVKWVARDERGRECRNDEIEDRRKNLKGCDEFEPPSTVDRSKLWKEHRGKIPKVVDTVELAVEEDKLIAKYELPKKKLPLFQATVEIEVSSSPLIREEKKIYVNCRKQDDAVEKVEELANERNWKMRGLDMEYLGQNYDIQPDLEKVRRNLSLPKEERS